MQVSGELPKGKGIGLPVSVEPSSGLKTPGEQTQLTEQHINSIPKTEINALTSDRTEMPLLPPADDKKKSKQESEETNEKIEIDKENLDLNNDPE